MCIRDSPYRYPNLDFYSSDYLRKMNSRYEATAEISCGGKRAHFYSNINYYRQGDYFKNMVGVTHPDNAEVVNVHIRAHNHYMFMLDVYKRQVASRALTSKQFILSAVLKS